MTRQILIAVAVILVIAGVAHADEKFEHATIRLEQSITDKDAEIMLEATGGDAGLAILKVVAPDGRVVADFKAPNSKLGIRHFKLESPEPKNDGQIQADFPAGEYTFTGTTMGGVKLHSKALLSHKLPDAASFSYPQPDAKGVPVKGMLIKWSAVRNLAAYVITIEQEKTDIKMSATLPGTTTTFALPDGFLIPNAEYKIAISTVSLEGNMSAIETSFMTAGKK